MAEEKTENWADTKAHSLIMGYIGSDHKVLDMQRFHAALAQALDEAHEEGFAAGMLLSRGST